MKNDDSGEENSAAARKDGVVRNAVKRLERLGYRVALEPVA
jgi:hypothetical protein